MRWIAPFFRYSYSRDAFILRGIGRYAGPVFRVTHGPRARSGDRRWNRAATGVCPACGHGDTPAAEAPAMRQHAESVSR